MLLTWFFTAEIVGLDEFDGQMKFQFEFRYQVQSQVSEFHNLKFNKTFKVMLAKPKT